MAFAGINYLAVIIAAVAAWIVGAAYYTALSKPWIAAHGKTVEAFKAELFFPNPPLHPASVKPGGRAWTAIPRRQPACAAR